MTITSYFIYFKQLSEANIKKLDATPTKKGYRIPNTLGALRELDKLGLLDEDGKTYYEQKKNMNFIHLMMKNQKHDVQLPGDPLRPYQRQDAVFLSALDSAAVFNEQRTGKSPTILDVIKRKKLENVIIVCPASLLVNWQNEVWTWLKKPSTIIKGTKAKRQKLLNDAEGILIVSYETLRNDVEHFTQLKHNCLVVDEAHRLRNYKSKQSGALYKLGKKMKYKYALTGTPAVNHPSDVFGILRLLYPERFSSYWQFVGRYFTIEDNFFGKEVGDFKRRDELQEILDTISTNRKRKDVMNWIPPKQYSTVELEAETKQMKAYNEMLNTFEVESADLDASTVLAQLTRLRQICLDPQLLGIEAKSPKEAYVLDWIQDNKDEPVIIFSMFSSYLKKLASKIDNCSVIHGEMTAEQKQQAAKDFQEGKTSILLANIISAGTGFTLDRAETTIFLDKSFTPTDNEQAEDRFIPTKLSRNHSCLIIDLVIKGTVEEKINKMLKNKKDVIKYVNSYGLKGGQ